MAGGEIFDPLFNSIRLLLVQAPFLVDRKPFPLENKRVHQTSRYDVVPVPFHPPRSSFLPFFPSTLPPLLFLISSFLSFTWKEKEYLICNEND